MKMKYLFLGLVTVLCCGGMLMANPPKEDGERIEIRNEQTDCEILAFQKTREANAEISQNEQKDAIEAAPTEESRAASSKAMALFSNQAMNIDSLKNTMGTASGLSFISYPGAYHPLVRFLGNEVRLEDGSWWKIYSGDFSETSNWLTESDLSISDLLLGLTPDTVVITANPDYPLFSSFRYHLTNQQTGKFVRANLSDFYSGSNTRYIYSHVWLYDAYGNLFVQLTLNDGSIWNTLPLDTQCLDWHNGDILIVGVNTDAFSTLAPYTLINVRTNNYGAASCVLYYN